MAVVLHIELVLKEKITPPNPVEILEGIETNGGLRANTGEAYVVFCENFLQCVCTDEDWKMHSRHSRFSDFVDTSLEAFGLLTYLNGYHVWKKRFKNEGAEESDVSTVTTEGSCRSSETLFRFTSNARGSKKYSGWSAEGIGIYNTVMEVLTTQRGAEKIGRVFDDRVLGKLSSKRKRQKVGARDAVPRAKNNLDKLMQTVRNATEH